MHRPWYRRVWLWGLLVLVLLGVAIRIAIDPLARHFTQQALDQLPHERGTFDGVHVSILKLSYTIDGLKIVDDPPNGHPPLIYAQEIEAHLLWSDLFKLQLAGVAHVDRTKATLVLEPGKAGAEPSAPEIPDLRDALYNLIPFRVERVEMRDDEALIIDRSEKLPAELWIHHIEASFENLASRRKLTKGEATTFAFKAQIQRSGTLTIFVTVDPLEHQPTFVGETKLSGMKLSELYGFIASQTGLQIPQGTLDVFANFKAEKGAFTGAVKPVLKEVKVTAAENNLGKAIEAKVANAAIGLASDRVPGRNAVVAIVPIQGKLTDPKADIWTTILTVVRNAYVTGIQSGFEHVPPPQAAEKQGPVKQAEQALSKNNFPKAQPPTDAGKDKKGQ